MGREAGSMYFYPRSPRGERPRFLPGRPEAVKNFYPRSPRGERLITASRFRPSSYFYPRSPRGERQLNLAKERIDKAISIHAPRVGSDMNVNALLINGLSTFLSTLPAWGATDNGQILICRQAHFYPRSPRGERLYWCSSSRTIFDISIHAPRVGSDYKAEYVG